MQRKTQEGVFMCMCVGVGVSVKRVSQLALKLDCPVCL